MSPKSKPARMQPPHRQVAEVQAAVRAALALSSERHDPAAVLAALTHGQVDDSDGLADLLADLGVRTPTDLVILLQLMTASASFASLSWARGLPRADGGRYTAEDVLRAAWANVEYRAQE